MRRMVWRETAPHEVSMSVRSLLPAALITLAAVALLAPSAQAAHAAPSAQAATPGSIQVSGNHLKSALPPASFFGSSYKARDAFDTGKSLEHYPASRHPATMSCVTAWTMYNTVGYGETAFADDGVLSSNGQDAAYLPGINQFANPRTAAAVFDAQRAKSASCRTYTLPSPKGSPTEHVAQSVSTVHPGGHEAFLVTQVSTFSGQPGSVSAYILVTVDGADLFTVESPINVTDTMPVHPSLQAVTIYMIGKVAALR
jgi:hypothetical protein